MVKQLSPSIKHRILTHYTSPHNHDTLDRILLLHDVHVSRRAVERWRKEWNGEENSLQHHAVSGRPHILTPTEVGKYITQPIRRMNRSHRNVSYSMIARRVRENTRKSITDRTVRLIGLKKLGGRKTKGRKSTTDECEYMHSCNET